MARQRYSDCVKGTPSMRYSCNESTSKTTEFDIERKSFVSILCFVAKKMDTKFTTTKLAGYFEEKEFQIRSNAF